MAQDKIVAVVHGSAANKVLARELLDGWSDLSHTVQLAVNAGLALNAIARLIPASLLVISSTALWTWVP